MGRYMEGERKKVRDKVGVGGVEGAEGGKGEVG